jgi:hypothetical protein
MLWLTVSRPVYLGVRHSCWAHDQILLLLDICRFMDVDMDVRNHSRVPFRRDSRSNITVSNVRLPPNLECQFPVFISSRNRITKLQPWVPFSSPLTTRRARVVVFDLAPHGHELCPIRFSAQPAQEMRFLIITSAGPPRKHHSSVAQSGQGPSNSSCLQVISHWVSTASC